VPDSVSSQGALSGMSEQILAEVQAATIEELASYFCGAGRDGTTNAGRNTFRISQKDARWLEVLREIVGRLGRKRLDLPRRHQRGLGARDRA
jgi:hypothetical protein